MKSIRISLIALFALGLMFSSCVKESLCIRGTGAEITKTLDIPDFHSIDLREAGDIIISQGLVQQVKVTGNANIIKRVEKEVFNGLWVIDLGKGCFDYNNLHFEITIPDISEIALSGSGDIEVQDFQNQPDLSLIVSGSGQINLGQVTGLENAKIKISGSGSIEADASYPTLQDLDISISGSGDFEGFKMKTQDCDIQISGSGSCEVNVEEELDVRITGSGEVFYRGFPNIVQHITGSGRLVNVN